MTVSNLDTIKGLLLAANELLKEDNREAASNLMELALDQMDGLSSEDIDVGLQVKLDAPAEEEVPAAETSPTDAQGVGTTTADLAAADGTALYSLVERLKDGARREQH